jgi:hypothetical protein
LRPNGQSNILVPATQSFAVRCLEWHGLAVQEGSKPLGHALGKEWRVVMASKDPEQGVSDNTHSTPSSGLLVCGCIGGQLQ